MRLTSTVVKGNRYWQIREGNKVLAHLGTAEQILRKLGEKVRNKTEVSTHG